MKFFLLVLLLFSADAQAEIEVICLAKNIYFESRNQPLVGRLAVAQVTLNRRNSPKFPSTLCKVVKQYRWVGERKVCQFSWYCDGKSDTPKNKERWYGALQEAAFILTDNGKFDIVNGALWYHADYTKPVWAKKLRKTVQINEHIFYDSWD
jgi:spore germination cell wall hydrolase CwlJ-like protein